MFYYYFLTFILTLTMFERHYKLFAFRQTEFAMEFPLDIGLPIWW